MVTLISRTAMTLIFASSVLLGLATTAVNAAHIPMHKRVEESTGRASLDSLKMTEYYGKPVYI